MAKPMSSRGQGTGLVLALAGVLFLIGRENPWAIVMFLSLPALGLGFAFVAALNIGADASGRVMLLRLLGVVAIAAEAWNVGFGAEGTHRVAGLLKPLFGAHALLMVGPALVLAVLVAGIALFALTGGTWADFGTWAANIRRRGSLRKDHLTGMQLVDRTRPAKGKVSDPVPPQVSLGRVPYPSPETEKLHTVIEGATGSGKTQAIKTLIDGVLARGDNLIVIDGGSDLFKTFGPVAGEVRRFDLLDPETGFTWSPQGEVERPTDWDMMAQGLIGDGEGDSAEWRSMAKAFFASVCRGYDAACTKAGRRFSDRDLFELLMSASDEAVAPFIAGSPAAALIGNGKGLSNIRMSLLKPLAFWEHLPDPAKTTAAPFSARAWLRETMGAEGGSRALFYTFRKRDLPTVKNLLSAQIEMLIATAIDAAGEQGPSKRPIWLVIDELAGLGEVPALLTAAAELRKTGLRLLVGCQDYDQIEALYGRFRAASVMNNLSNKLFLRTNSGTSAERQSRTLGERTVLVHRTSHGPDDTSVFGPKLSVSHDERQERAVTPADILGLPDLTGYARFAGENVVSKTIVPVLLPPEEHSERESTWTEQRRASS